MAKLIVRLPDGRTRDYELGPVSSLGRHPNQTIQVLDRLVSKEHIVVRGGDDGWSLQDLGSLNGTYLNDQRVSGTVPLKHRDRVSLGATKMIFHNDEQAGTGQHKISIGDALESNICNAVAQTTAEEFLPVEQMEDVDALRRDYEKLRMAARLQLAISGEVRLDRLLPLLLDHLFALFQVDRGVILLREGESERLVPRAVKVRGKRTSEPIELSKTILRKVLSERKAVLTNDALHDARFAHAKSIIIQGIRSSMCVPLLARDRSVLGVIHLDSQMAINAFTEKDLAMLQGIAQQASIAVENSQLVQRIEQAAVTRQKFEKMLSPNLVERVVSGDLEIKIGGDKRPATILFTDIRGFTKMAERSPPEDLVKMLNEYFELIVDVIFEFEGTLDKFMGDGVMAIWGAPVEVPDAALKSVSAAVKIQKALRGFNNLREMDGLPPIHTGVGVHTGEVIAGYMGSSKTMSYTVIGRSVNLASRLCSAAPAGEVLVSEAAMRACRGRLVDTRREMLQLKGIEGEVPAWSIQDIRA
ncbi:MAG: GAF domain-containing protein [Deltaproteobacteria bacterium]|nr:GAF domain-containing protein [Deltaproteobacteria bacterium]